MRTKEEIEHKIRLLLEIGNNEDRFSEGKRAGQKNALRWAMSNPESRIANRLSHLRTTMGNYHGIFNEGVVQGQIEILEWVLE